MILWYFSFPSIPPLSICTLVHKMEIYGLSHKNYLCTIIIIICIYLIPADTLPKGYLKDNKICHGMSIIVGCVLLLLGIIVIVITLSLPEVRGLSEDDALRKGQAILLGCVTFILLVMSVVAAIIHHGNYPPFVFPAP